MASPQRCTEFDVFQRFHATLNTSITDPDIFAGHLIAGGFMSRQVADNKMPFGLSTFQKVSNLLGVVDCHIKSARVVSYERVKERFRSFLSILSNPELDLGHIARKMEEQCYSTQPIQPQPLAASLNTTEHSDAHSETLVSDVIALESHPSESDVYPSQLSHRHVNQLANEGVNLIEPNYRHPARYRPYLKAHTLRCNRKCLFLIHFLFIVATALTVLAIEQKSALIDIIEGRHSYLVREFYSPGDSRLLPLSAWFSVFHRSIDLELTGDKFTASASIYVVDSSFKIPLKYNNTAPVEERHVVAEDTYRFWKFYLYSNSVINGTVCTSEQPLETFIVQGHHNMDNWHRTYHHKYVISNRHRLVSNCQSVTNINYTVVKEDYYFVVVFNRDNAMEPLVNVKLNFKRFQYSYSRPPNCTLTPYKQCSVSIPFPYSFTQEFSLLILTSIPREVDWDEEMFIKMSYRYRIIPCFFVSVICYILTGLVCSWCYQKYCKK